MKYRTLILLIPVVFSIWLWRKTTPPAPPRPAPAVTWSTLQHVAVEDSGAMTKRSQQTLAAGLQSEDNQVRGYAARLARGLLVEWVATNDESNWHRRHDVDRFFQLLDSSGDPEFQKFKELNPNSRAVRYLRQISMR